MKKIIFRSFVIFFITAFTLIVYLSTLGIETTRFNNQIINILKNFNKDLEVELKKVKILVDPFNFEINAKTVGSKFVIKKKTIEIEKIKTRISINSLINDQFSLKDLEISTKSIEIKNLISFVRNFKNTPELYLFEKIFKKGYLISNINLEFDSQGKIKKNYKIKGFIKNARINLLKSYSLNDLNLILNVSKDNFQFKDIKLSLNKLPILSEKISVKKINNSFVVDGSLENKNIILEDKLIYDLIKTYLLKFEIEDLNFNSKSQFSFRVNKKYKIDNFKLSSKIKINHLRLPNQLKIKSFLPSIKDKINIKNHIININFHKKNLKIEGNGNILLQNNEDSIDYKINKLNKSLNFEIFLKIKNNPVLIDFLGFKKRNDSNIDLDFKGSYIQDDNLQIKSFSINEDKNKLEVEGLFLDKDFKIKKFKKAIFNYFDEDRKKNELSIVNKDGFYNLVGTQFNANRFIENLIEGNNSNKSKIFSQNFNINIELKRVLIDEKYTLKNFIGYLNFQNNEVTNAEINAFFSKNKNFKFTIKSNQNEKVTTFFLDEAEPIVKRYKFIKGYRDGSLDFYSSKKGNLSKSNLKIYDFRLKELSILTKLLTLASLQGIADILSGEGITFDEFEMIFKNQDDLMTIEEIYAIGPAISVLMDGYVEKDKLISLRGSLVPATTINKAIGSIPVLGKILVGSKTGEGVFGVSFKIKGSPKNLETTVNPIKTLTPRFITRTLEKIKKN